MSKEWLLALGTHKVLYVPLLAESGDHPLLDGTTTSTTDGNAHLVVASQTIQLAFDLASARSQLDATLFAIEMVRMVGFTL